MLSKELKKIIKLSKKTGDRVIVFDAQEPESTFVLMDLLAYEKLLETEVEKKEDKVGDDRLELDKKELKERDDKKQENSEKQGLTEEYLTDRINKEISLWKNQENPSFVTGDEKLERTNKPWSISPKVKQKAKEVE